MGRKRRKELKVTHKKLPSIFNCPNCGMNSVSVEIDNETRKAAVKCGSCGRSGEYVLKTLQKKIDAYNMFVDQFFEEAAEPKEQEKSEEQGTPPEASQQ